MKINKSILVVLMITCLFLAIMGLSGCDGTKIKNILVDTSDAEMVFEVGAEFNAENIVVFAKQSNGKNVRIPTEEYNVSTPDISSAGEKTVTVTYKEMSVDYKINVVVRQEAAKFKGNITSGLGAGNTITFEADFICYNTLRWELWYKDNPNNPNSYGKKDSGKYKLANGVYSMILTTHTASTTIDDTSAVSFEYVGVALPIMGGMITGTFYGTLTLVTA